MVFIWYPILFEKAAYCPSAWCWHTLYMDCKKANMDSSPVVLLDLGGFWNKVFMGIL